MSEENVEAIRERYEHFARGDFSPMANVVENDFVFVASPELPDAGTYSGEAALRWLNSWVGSFEGLTIEATEIVDAGDRVLAGIIQRGRPHGSETEVEGRWWSVDTFREGVAIRTELFPDRAQAVRAAGLSE